MDIGRFSEPRNRHANPRESSRRHLAIRQSGSHSRASGSRSKVHVAVEVLARQVVGAGSRRDQIKRVADRIDCGKLTERICRRAQCANIDLLCLHAADVDLRDVGDIVFAKRVHPAAANYGGAGLRAVTDAEEIVARAADQSVNARAADRWSHNGNYSIKRFLPPEQSPQTTKYCCWVRRL